MHIARFFVQKNPAGGGILICYFFICFNFWANVNVYWVADHRDATNANHRPHMPMYGNIVINHMTKLLSVVVMIVDNANNNNNAEMATICNVVLIFPMEKRGFGTAISIFCVPRNSRRPLMYSSRATIIMIGTKMNHTGVMMANMINAFTTNNLSPM